MLARSVVSARRIAYAGYSSGQATASSTLTIARPSAASPGTLLTAFIVDDDGRTITPPSGWTTRIDINGGSARRAIYTKIAGDSEPANYTWTLSGSDDVQGYILAWGSATYDAIGTIGSLASPSVAPSVTVTAASSIVLAWYSRGGIASMTFSTPSGYTALVSDSDASNPSSAIFYKEVNAGATGTASSTPTGGSASGVQIAIKLS